MQVNIYVVTYHGILFGTDGDGNETRRLGQPDRDVTVAAASEADAIKLAGVVPEGQTLEVVHVSNGVQGVLVGDALPAPVDDSKWIEQINALGALLNAANGRATGVGVELTAAQAKVKKLEEELAIANAANVAKAAPEPKLDELLAAEPKAPGAVPHS